MKIEKLMAQNEEEMNPVLLDDIINRLLEFRQARTPRQVHLSESDIRQLCCASKQIFLQQPTLLELEAPIKICGIYITTLIICLCIVYLCLVQVLTNVCSRVM